MDKSNQPTKCKKDYQKPGNELNSTDITLIKIVVFHKRRLLIDTSQVNKVLQISKSQLLKCDPFVYCESHGNKNEQRGNKVVFLVLLLLKPHRSLWATFRNAVEVNMYQNGCRHEINHHAIFKEAVARIFIFFKGTLFFFSLLKKSLC